MRRVVEPELLDSLPPENPAAIRSRRDLRRLNWWMNNETHLCDAILNLPTRPATILELGTGDGTVMLSLAKRLEKYLPSIRLYLLDMEPVISAETLEEFAQLGWRVEIIRANLREWIDSPAPAQVDLTMANLFLHHFQDDELRATFAALDQITRSFVACEPRRWRPALVATRLLWTIRCNHVTRHDATVSVRAGFNGHELSERWPSPTNATLTEYPAGYASHLFTAHRG